MRLHYIYIAIGLSTLILNGILTFRILHGIERNKRNEAALDSQDTMTFHLRGKHKSSEEETVTELMDDTVLLER